MNTAIKSSGNTTVDRLANLQLYGNIIPHSWYNAITLKDGKPDLIAIIILADILYWYRPKEIIDEKTGEVIGYKKKFNNDALQRSYSQLMDMFNLSRKQVGRALKVLCELNLIKKDKRNETINYRNFNNVLYLKLNADRLLEITFPPDNHPLLPLKKGDSLPEGTTLPPSREQDPLFERTTLLTSREQDYFPEGGTNTENTTDITADTITDISSESIPQKQWTDEELYKANEELIKENIEYDILMDCLDLSAQQRLDHILSLILDVIMTDRETIRIRSKDMPVSIVRSVYKKLTKKDITHVLNQIAQNTNQIHDMNAYLLTLLFNAPNDTADHFCTLPAQDSS